MVEIILFWIPILLLFHSYVLFPALLHFQARNKHDNPLIYTTTSTLPTVSIIISVYNEENVIEQRIGNIFSTSYPLGKIEILVGSDGSTDHTNALLTKLQNEHPSTLRPFIYSDRKGKGNVLNRLVSEAKGEILVLTDAKVQFARQAISEMAKHFANPKIGIVGGNIINKNYNRDGISIQEKRFMSREIIIKYNEGKLWGTVMGAYGACFALRRELFETIPSNFAVEDFFLTLRTLEKKYDGIIELNAICYEDVPNLMREEFRRKVRISSGNFQNIQFFSHLLVKLNSISYCFYSHKVIRWIGPFLLILILGSNGLLINRAPIYVYSLLLQVFLLTLPIIDFFLHKIHLHIIPLRFVTHFYSMNLALLFGFIKYLKGVKTNVWEPTKRGYQQAQHHRRSH